ncbi:MAG TPA: glycosyltransferase family 2 protein, partial [Candidatus Sulfotelmatobacter sp.]|nr:glycosyltransferase family 2 protein [Candidatus Sulfotelmatobacter sp.]
MQLSVVIITFNEEANIGRTLQSVQPLVSDGKGEIIVVDSGSSDRTVEIAKSFGAKVFVEDWKGYATQKNSAIDKATGDWILSLDADEELSDVAQGFLLDFFGSFGSGLRDSVRGVSLGRRNYFLGRWIKHGGFYPDRKVRLIPSGGGRFQERMVHEDIKLKDGQLIFNPSLHWSW